MSHSPINEFFDKVIVINLARRKDRWEECLAELSKHSIVASRLEGVEMREWGNDGCTWAHRKVLDIIASSTWRNCLVLEDDFQCRSDDTQDKFFEMAPMVPDDWDFLFLGGHYADPPVRRVNEHVIQFHRMKTTSSYGITREMAGKMAAGIYGTGPIDELFGSWTETNNAYILIPRLMIQRPGFSDIQRRHCSNSACMEDTRHEEMVPLL